jgi:hypothetical protein
MITQELLHTLFDYKNGHLYRKNIRKAGIKAGSLAGYKNNNGYLQVTIQRKKYLIHRIVFLMHYGYLPDEIDHINNTPTDNRIENLREATRLQNCHNQKMTTKNKTGAKNVIWINKRKKWRVAMRINGKAKSFGYFFDLELADLVAQEVRNKYHKQFANHNF